MERKVKSRTRRIVIMRHFAPTFRLEKYSMLIDSSLCIFKHFYFYADLLEFHINTNKKLNCYYYMYI